MNRELSIQSCAAQLERRGFRVFTVATLAAATELMRGLIKELAPKSVSYGGSMTLQSSGILSELEANPDVEFINGFQPGMEREEKWAIRRRGMTAELFLSGVNVVCMDGSLHWMDMVGNRVAPIAFGPKHVILLAGGNKLVATPQEARERIRSIAPRNAKNHGFKTPCVVTGVCVDCNAPERLCNVQMSIAKCYPQGRIIVILMEEAAGL